MKVLVHNVDDQIHVTHFTPEARKKDESDGDFFKRMAPSIVPSGVEYDVVDYESLDTRYPGKWCKASQSMKYNWPKAYAQKMDELLTLAGEAMRQTSIDIEIAHDYDDDEKAAMLVKRRKQLRFCLLGLDLSHILSVQELADFLPKELKG